MCKLSSNPKNVLDVSLLLLLFHYFCRNFYCCRWSRLITCPANALEKFLQDVLLPLRAICTNFPSVLGFFFVFDHIFHPYLQPNLLSHLFFLNIILIACVETHIILAIHRCFNGVSLNRTTCIYPTLRKLKSLFLPILI